MRVLVTGGAGFQGSHLVARWIQAGHDVTILNTFSEMAELATTRSASDARVIWGSVTDKEIVRKTARNQDVIVHLAARISVDESIADPESILEVNVMGTFNILESVRETGARLIYASTCEAYGYAPPPITEHSEFSPHSPYAASKAAADRLCYAYYKTYGIDVTIVRPCNIYGEGQKADQGGAVIPTMVGRGLAGQPVSIHGDGSQRREYMHVSDLASAYDLLLGSTGLSGEVFNVGSGETISIRHIAEIVADQLGAQIEYHDSRPGEVQGFGLESSKAKKLGFSPKVRFEEGLPRYIEWRKKTQAK
jgi:dTDP-glucose 4,6-dehydratase